MRQVLLESLLLSLLGGALGVLFSTWILDLLVRLMPKELPRLDHVSINAPALAFAVSISILAGLLFGLVPAWRMSHLDPSLTLRGGARGMTGGRRRNLLHNWLVIAETAVSLVLLKIPMLPDVKGSGYPAAADCTPGSAARRARKAS
jgi:predicted lysophospholipase L1 biosynthesis ABC-type transport system permease subunit